MKDILVVCILVLVSILCGETLFEVKDASNNKVLDVSTDGLRIMNQGDTLMVISSNEIRANISSSKGLSRTFSVTTNAAKGQGIDLMRLTADSTRFWISDSGSGFGVSSLTAAKEKSVSTNFLKVSNANTEMREGTAGERYTDFSPDNIFLGLKAGLLTVPGYINYTDVGKNNLFIGNYAGFSHTEGMNNIFLGNSAGYITNYGSRNVFMGVNAGYNNKTGADNVYIGTEAGKGYQSGSIFSNGDSNVFIGVKSGYTIRTGFQNVALGYWSGYNNQAGNYNVFLGGLSGVNNVDGIENVYVGYGSGAFNTGSNNVFLGKNGNLNNRSINGCVFLGNNAGSPETTSNKLYIDNSSTTSPLIYGDFDTDIVTVNGTLNSTVSGSNIMRMTSTSHLDTGIELLRTGTSYYDWQILNSGGNLKFSKSNDDMATKTDAFQITLAGNVGVGSTAPSQKFDVYGGNGRVESGYSWLTSSDERFKKNITTLENSLENVMKMRGVRYDLKEDKNSSEGEGKHIGFIAQELEKVYDELVVEDEKGYKSVAYDKVTAVLVEALKEQHKEIDKLNKKLEKLEKLINEKK